MQFIRRTLIRALASCAGILAFKGGLSVPARAQTGAAGVVLCISLEPDSLDPTTASAASIGEVVHYSVFENLVKIDESGAISAWLAESWVVDADARRYTFKLRQGVKFHDGAAFDASSVRFTLERAKAAGAANKAKKALFDNIAHIETPDSFTVVLTLHNADGNTLFRLGESPAVMLHPQSAADASTHPVGTGPYRFEQWVKGWGVTLVKSETYRQAAQVKMDKVTFRFISSPSEQAQAVLAGDIDVFFNIATQNASVFRSDNRYQVLIGASSGKGMLAINNQRKPLDDVRVRRAITHAIDREAFIKDVLEGRGRAIGSHFSPTDAGYINLAGVYPFDPARARALLKEAGVKLPLKLTLTLPPTPYAQSGAPMVVAALAKVGILAKVEPVDWSQWLAGAFKGQFDLTIINHVEPLDYQIYTDPQYYFGYDSATFRDLVARHARSTQARERKMLFAQMQRHLAADAVNAWMFAPQLSIVARKGLKGLWMNYPIFAHDVAALSWE